MIRRSVIDGLLVGLALTLVCLFPLFTVLVYPRVLHMPWPPVADWLRSLLLLASGVAGCLVLGLVGSLVVVRSGITSPGQGFKAGALSGLVAALVFYILVVEPTQSVVTTARLWQVAPTLEAPYPSTELLRTYLYQGVRGSLNEIGLCLAVGVVIGGLEGAFVGLLHRRRAVPSPSLLELVTNLPSTTSPLLVDQPRQRWFEDRDEIWRAGILAGLIGGGVVWISTTVNFLSGLRVQWPELDTLGGQLGNRLSRAMFSQAAANLLSPFLLLALFGTGALAVLLLRDPTRRHLSRFQAVIIAGVTTALTAFTAVAGTVRFYIAIARYEAFQVAQQLQPLPAGGASSPDGEIVLDPSGLEMLRAFVHTPHMLLPLFYLIILGLLAGVLIFAVAWIAPQAAFYGLVLPIVFKRPVDRAGRIVRALRGEPSSLLPRLYRLFAQDAQALKVLPHLAFLVKDLPAKQVVAAYHTLASRPDQMEQAVPVIRQTVAEQETWRWRAEIGELYRVLEEGLAVKTLAQVRAIDPPPQEVTSSLPVLLAKSCEGLGRILAELAKVERVDDLGTKIIFLNSTQAALLDLRRYIDHESDTCPSCATPYPEFGVLNTLLDRWQGLVVAATQDLQGRANLQLDLKVHRTAFAPKVCACIGLCNQGLNVAQNIRLQLADGEGYQIVDGAQQQVEILSPQESRDLEFVIAPAGPGRLRLTYTLTYDDAVDCGRQMTFADAIDLDQEAESPSSRPWERIFPIPYVTGTPLRSGEMFVGRQDVFDFVSEHLLGAYQNNVIVLHGQRRTGKTSILYRLQEVLAGTHISVLVDMQGKAARGMADFLYALSDDIVYALENHSPSIAVELPDRAEYETAPEFTFRSRFLRSVVGALDQADGLNLLLMFDEFEELQKRVEDGRLEPEVFPFLRNLMQHESRVDFIFSGTHKLEELGAEYWSILFNIAVYKRITFLSPDDVRRLVAGPVAPYGLEYDPLAIDRIIQVTAGHPYFTQVVCHEMVAYHNEVKRNYLTASCVDQALERIVERGEAHFKYIWSGATPDEQRVMLSVTDLLPDPDAGATPAQIAAELAHKGVTLSEEALTRALAHLQAKDILARSGPQSSLYRFKIDLIRRWIGATRPAPAG